MATMRDFFTDLAGILAGFLVGALALALALGIQLRQHEPGLWTVRVQRIVNCGLDYNGPPYTTSGDATLWLTCGSDEQSWRLWPPGEN